LKVEKSKLETEHKAIIELANDENYFFDENEILIVE